MVDEANKTVPTEAAARMESAVSLVSQRLMQKRRDLRTKLGARPFRGQPVDSEEGFKQYLQVRHDPVAWAEVLANSVRFSADGRLLVHRDLADSISKFETRLRTGSETEGTVIE